MALQDHYNESVTVKRLEPVLDDEYEDTGKREYAIHIEDLFCEIQPLQDAIGQDIQGGFGKDWLMFCDVEDIIEGDRIIRYGGAEYRVVGVKNFDSFRNKPQHLEIRLRIFES